MEPFGSDLFGTTFSDLGNSTWSDLSVSGLTSGGGTAQDSIVTSTPVSTSNTPVVIAGAGNFVDPSSFFTGGGNVTITASPTVSPLVPANNTANVTSTPTQGSTAIDGAVINGASSIEVDSQSPFVGDATPVGSLGVGTTIQPTTDTSNGAATQLTGVATINTALNGAKTQNATVTIPLDGATIAVTGGVKDGANGQQTGSGGFTFSSNRASANVSVDQTGVGAGFTVGSQNDTNISVQGKDGSGSNPDSLKLGGQVRLGDTLLGVNNTTTSVPGGSTSSVTEGSVKVGDVGVTANSSGAIGVSYTSGTTSYALTKGSDNSVSVKIADAATPLASYDPPTKIDYSTVPTLSNADSFGYSTTSVNPNQDLSTLYNGAQNTIDAFSGNGNISVGGELGNTNSTNAGIAVSLNEPIVPASVNQNANTDQSLSNTDAFGYSSTSLNPNQDLSTLYNGAQSPIDAFSGNGNISVGGELGNTNSTNAGIAVPLNEPIVPASVNQNANTDQSLSNTDAFGYSSTSLNPNQDLSTLYNGAQNAINAFNGTREFGIDSNANGETANPTSLDDSRDSLFAGAGAPPTRTVFKRAPEAKYEDAINATKNEARTNARVVTEGEFAIKTAENPLAGVLDGNSAVTRDKTYNLPVYKMQGNDQMYVIPLPNSTKLNVIRENTSEATATNPNPLAKNRVVADVVDRKAATSSDPGVYTNVNLYDSYLPQAHLVTAAFDNGKILGTGAAGVADKVLIFNNNQGDGYRADTSTNINKANGVFPPASTLQDTPTQTTALYNQSYSELKGQIGSNSSGVVLMSPKATSLNREERTRQSIVAVDNLGNAYLFASKNRITVGQAEAAVNQVLGTSAKRAVNDSGGSVQVSIIDTDGSVRNPIVGTREVNAILGATGNFGSKTKR